MEKALYSWAKKAAEKGTAWPKDKLKVAKKVAEKLKGKEEVDNPHALARWMTAHKAKGG